MKPLAWTGREVPEVAEGLISEAPAEVPTTAVPPVKVGVTLILVAPKGGVGLLMSMLPAGGDTTVLLAVLFEEVVPPWLVTLQATVTVLVAPAV